MDRRDVTASGFHLRGCACWHRAPLRPKSDIGFGAGLRCVRTRTHLEGGMCASSHTFKTRNELPEIPMCATPHTLYPRPDGCLGALNLGRSTTRQAVRFGATFWPHVPKIREKNYTTELKRRLFLEGHVKGRVRRAVWVTISRLVKLVYPSADGISSEEVSDEVLRWAA